MQMVPFVHLGDRQRITVSSHNSLSIDPIYAICDRTLAHHPPDRQGRSFWLGSAQRYRRSEGDNGSADNIRASGFYSPQEKAEDMTAPDPAQRRKNNS
jgi:hypothetical protein